MTRPDQNALEKLADGVIGGWSKSRVLYEPEAATIKALIADLTEARGLLADLMVWFGKYPEFKPNPDYMSGVTQDIAKTRAFLARNGKGEATRDATKAAS